MGPPSKQRDASSRSPQHAMGTTRVVPLSPPAGTRTRRSSLVRDPTWESWWLGFKATTTQHVRPRFSIDKARKFIHYSETTSKLHQATVLLMFPVPGLLSALVAPMIPLRDPSEGISRNYGFICHAFITVWFTMSGAMMEIRAVCRIPRSDYSNREIGAVGMLGSLHVVGVAVVLARFWRFPIPFVWILLALPWLVFLMWSNLLVLRSKLLRNKAMRSNLIFSLPQLAVQLCQIALYPAYSALFEASNEWQQLVLIAVFPLLKIALKRLVFAVSHHLSDYAKETAISGVEISASMYQSMIMQSSPSQLATALVIGVDLIQGVVDVKRFMEGSSIIPKRELIAAATRILHHDEGVMGTPTTARAHAGSHPCGPQSPVRLVSNSDARSRNKAILGQALEMLQSAETILLIEYIEVAVPITNAMFLCVASQLQSALFNPKLRKFYGNYTELGFAISTMLLYTFLQAATLLLMCLVMRVRYRVSAFTLLAFVLEHHAWSLHGKMIAWLTSILEFSVIHFGVDFTFTFDFRMDK